MALEILICSPENRTGECKVSGSAVKQGSVVVKDVDTGVNVAKLAPVGSSRIFIAKRYEFDAFKMTSDAETMTAGDRLVTLEKGRFATDQFDGVIGDYVKAEALVINTEGKFGKVAATVNPTVAYAVGTDGTKLIVDVI